MSLVLHCEVADGEVVLLDQQHRQAAPGGVARDAGAVDAAADDEEIVDGGMHWIFPPRYALRGRFALGPAARSWGAGFYRSDSPTTRERRPAELYHLAWRSNRQSTRPRSPIADIDRGYYRDHVLRLAQHPSETHERMMVRLLAFALLRRRRARVRARHQHGRRARPVAARRDGLDRAVDRGRPAGRARAAQGLRPRPGGPRARLRRPCGGAVVAGACATSSIASLRWR